MSNRRRARDESVQRIVEACLGMGRYRPSELLAWLVDRILHGFGIRSDEAPKDLHEWLRAQHLAYAKAVVENPFEDLLGAVYQELSSRGHRGALGQFFSPDAIAQLMSGLLGATDRLPAAPLDGAGCDLVRVCEPACGSGALLLGFMRSAVESQGAAVLERYSFTAIDLDFLCARMCAAQLLVNVHVQNLSVGELLVYHGDALGRPSDLRVVMHGTIRSLKPDLVLPALHPSRIAALTDAVAARPTAVVATTKRSTKDGEQSSVHGDEPDLFSAA